MSQQDPFGPDASALTQFLSLTTSPQSMQVSTSSEGSVRIVNLGTTPAYLAFGSSSVTSVIPSSTTAGTGMQLLPNSAEIFRNRPAMWLSAMSSAAGNTLTFTPGQGM